MVAPRITKCGHIFCWPCVLQYLAYDRDTRTAPTMGRPWKKCPLCSEHVHKHELKSVRIQQSHYYKEGSTLAFHLMVRSKGNTIVKNKFLSCIDLQNAEEESKKGTPCSASPSVTSLYAMRFPGQTEPEYQQSRYLLSEPSIRLREL